MFQSSLHSTPESANGAKGSKTTTTQVSSTEKHTKPSCQSDDAPKKQRFATLKSILTGDVHKHNAMFALERSIADNIGDTSSASSRRDGYQNLV